jgi:hypothetical protein
MTGLRAAWRRWSVSPPLVGLTRARIAFQWQLAGKPVPPPHIVKQRIVIGYQRRYKLRTFIETGTYTGEMVAAMSSRVAQIISIEVDPALHARAVERFDGQPHIRLLLGDSGVLLSQVLASLRDPALFWLDGHYMGEGTGRAEMDTPIVAEMKAIAAHDVSGHVVLIDDARLFDGTCGYPRLDEFTRWLTETAPRADICVDGDIIRCVFERGR